MNDRFKDLMHKIMYEYDNDAYVRISGDRGFDIVSPNLNRLWGSLHGMSILTMERYYKRTISGEYPDYTAKEFEEDLFKLRDALAHEFELINKANIEERRNSL